jgi:transcription elongation factor GreA
MAEEKTYYLSKEGLKRIKKDYEDLKQIKLMKTRGEAPKILHSEDVDSDYLALQEDLGLLDIKLSEMETILKNAKLIKIPPKDDQKIIKLGATVLVGINGTDDEFTIVGTLEANPAQGRISNESPVGKILLGKGVGEEIMVNSPNKTAYRIKKIKYAMS